jgi:TonB family protein
MRMRAAVLLLVAAVACRGSSDHSRFDDAGSTGQSEAPSAAATQAEVPILGTVEVVSSGLTGSLITDVHRPEVVYHPSPDWSGFPGGHLPGGGGLFKLRIGTSGEVLRVDVARPGHPEVDARIVSALQSWRFKPATAGGKPVEVDHYVTVNINFR